MTDTTGDAAPADAPDSADEERAPNTLLNALVGAVVSVLLSVLPFSTVVGGAVAGYLEGGDYGDGATVGAIAGAIAFLPFVVIGGAVLALFAATTFPARGVHVAFWVSALLVLLLAATYTVGFGAVGGVVGVYLKEYV